jgi:hypothetical protein
MTFAYTDNKGAQHQVEISAEELFSGPKKAGLTPSAYVNRKFADADLSIGPAFAQIQASAGICLPGSDNPFGLKATSMAALLDGTANFSAAVNTQQNTSPFGTSSRALTLISVIDAIENQVAKDRTTDADTFYGMVGTELSVNSGHFEQPVINYQTLGGPEQAKAVRVSQGATPSRMAFFSTADRIRRIGSWTIGMEFSEQALRATTLDFVTLTMARYLAVERDERAYRYIADLFLGNNDMVVGAVSSVASSTLDAASTGGVLTHKAWVKFLARNRKYRKITHAIMDMDTYLKVEGRTGRPGSNNYDPTLARIDPQGVMMNVGFGNDVKIFLVESAADGGPVPANTIYAVDASAAITLVRDSSAAYNAVEDFAMKRTTAMRMDWSEEVFRTFGDTDLKLFDILTITP